MDIRDLIATAHANGGGTFYYDPDSLSFVNTAELYRDGYYVAAPVKYEFQTANLIPADILGMVHKHELYAGRTNRYLGLWFNSVTGIWYLDISHYFVDKWDAMMVGKKHNQIAIWDVANSAEILVD
jgi:hypothetical protein